jgi:hypothetical protein
MEDLRQGKKTNEILIDQYPANTLHLHKDSNLLMFDYNRHFN